MTPLNPPDLREKHAIAFFWRPKSLTNPWGLLEGRPLLSLEPSSYDIVHVVVLQPRKPRLLSCANRSKQHSIQTRHEGVKNWSCYSVQCVLNTKGHSRSILYPLQNKSFVPWPLCAQPVPTITTPPLSTTILPPFGRLRARPSKTSRMRWVSLPMVQTSNNKSLLCFRVSVLPLFRRCHRFFFFPPISFGRITRSGAETRASTAIHLL